MQVARSIFKNIMVGNPITRCNDFLNPCSVMEQSVRFKRAGRRLRKPSWLPIAKSKMWRVHVRPVIPEDEFAEITRLHRHYKTYIKSLKRHFVDKAKKGEVTLSQEYLDKVEAEDFERCCKINDEWNADVRKEREAWRAGLMEEKELDIQENIKLAEEKHKSLLEKAEVEVLDAIESTRTAILANNIDQAIDNALAGPTVNFNSFLHTDGKFYRDKNQIASQSSEGEKRRLLRQ